MWLGSDETNCVGLMGDGERKNPGAFDVGWGAD